MAQAKTFELGWLGSAGKQTQNLSLAWLGLKRKWDIRAELGLGSERSGFSKLSLAQARKIIRAQALELRLNIGFLGLIHPVKNTLLQSTLTSPLYFSSLYSTIFYYFLKGVI